MGSQITPGEGQKYSEHGLPGVINQFAEWIGAIPDQSRGAPKPGTTAPTQQKIQRGRTGGGVYKRPERRREQSVRNPGFERSPFMANESFF
jgi:hypothetical protein